MLHARLQAYLKSIESHNLPATSCPGVIEDIEEVLGKSSLEEREVLFLTLVSDGHTVLRDKKERIKVVGEAIDLPETEVATFHVGGIINSLKLYSC
jgi:hypothetical protein